MRWSGCSRSGRRGSVASSSCRWPRRPAAALDEYRSFQERIERVTARINERFGRPGYQPVHLLAQHHEHDAVMELFRAADICVVTSLHDGMNLVCKEFVAARDDLQGVLILSRFAGAARELLRGADRQPVPRRGDGRRAESRRDDARGRAARAHGQPAQHGARIQRLPLGRPHAGRCRTLAPARPHRGPGAQSPVGMTMPVGKAPQPMQHLFTPRRRGRAGRRLAPAASAGLRFRRHVGAHRRAPGGRTPLAGRVGPPEGLGHATARGHRDRSRGGGRARAPGLRAHVHRRQPRR